MRDSLRYVLGVAGWSLFWVLVVLVVGALVLEWRLLGQLSW